MDERNGNVICLLDDEPSVLKATSRLLASVGWQTETFTEPDRFLQHVEQHQSKVAVVDIVMPQMGGLEVLAHVREISPETSVLILTGSDDPNLRPLALQRGAAGFFSKARAEEELLAAIEKAFAEGPRS